MYNQFEMILCQWNQSKWLNFYWEMVLLKLMAGKGSHRKFFNQSTGRTTLVPYHSKELKKGMEHTILTQAGLKK